MFINYITYLKQIIDIRKLVNLYKNVLSDQCICTLLRLFLTLLRY